MRFRRGLPFFASLLPLVSLLAVPLAGCGGDDTTSTGGGGTGAGGNGETLGPGEICDEPTGTILKMRFEPGILAVAKCAAGETCVGRKVELILDPDVCKPSKVTFESSATDVVPAPA